MAKKKQLEWISDWVLLLKRETQSCRVVTMTWLLWKTLSWIYQDNRQTWSNGGVCISSKWNRNRSGNRDSSYSNILRKQGKLDIKYNPVSNKALLFSVVEVNKGLGHDLRISGITITVLRSIMRWEVWSVCLRVCDSTHPAQPHVVATLLQLQGLQ